MPKSVSMPVGTHRRVRYLVPGILLASLVASGAVAAATAPGAAAATTPGSIDTTFGTAGWQSIAGTSVPGLGSASDAVTLPNGDILLGGSTGLARLLPSGQVDKSFGSGGSATAAGVGSVDSAAVIGVQPDGKIIYAGSTSSPTGGTEWEVARFTANGALDPTFGTGGIVTTEILNPAPTTITFEMPHAVLVQPDGKILVLGNVENFGGYRGQGSFFVQDVVRYNANGTLDAGFGAGGKAQSTTFAGAGELGLDAAGDIFIAPGPGWTSKEAELSPSGQADPAVTAAAITASSSPVLMPSGQFLVATTIAQGRGASHVQVTRYNPGSTVASTSAQLSWTSAIGKDAGTAVGTLSGGQALILGSHNNSASYVLASVNPDGTLDSTFGTGGITTFTPPAADRGGFFPVDALVLPTGKILVIGDATASDGTTPLTTLTQFIA
jgi:uncharacterized delta-60 repeat protein